MIRVDDNHEPDVPVLPPLKELGMGISMAVPEGWLVAQPVTTKTETATVCRPSAPESKQVHLRREGNEVRPLKIQKCRALKLPPLPVRSGLREKSSMAASFLRVSTVGDSRAGVGLWFFPGGSRWAAGGGGEKPAMGVARKEGPVVLVQSVTELETRELCKVLDGDEFRVRLFDGRRGLGIAMGGVRIG